MSKRLSSEEQEPLQWTGYFQFPDMMHVGVIQDGTNGLFTSCLQAFSIPYIESKVGGVPTPKYIQAQHIREDAVLELRNGNAEGANSYSALNKGQTQSFSQEDMKLALLSRVPLQGVFFEFLGNYMKLDIYVLDLFSEDVYIFRYDRSLLYKGRDSVVLLHIGNRENGYFETVGLLESDGTTKMVFGPTHQFIESLQKRLDQLQVSLA